MNEGGDNISDIHLMNGVLNNDYSSYNQLFTRYYTPLCRFVYGFVANRHDTEDIVQDVFLSLWDRRAKIRVTDNVKAYLYEMAKNTTLNHIRKEDNYRATLEQIETATHYDGNEAIDAAEMVDVVRDCIDRLPDRSRRIFLLDRIDGLKQKDISEQLGISVKTVKNQIWMALQALKRCFERKGVAR